MTALPEGRTSVVNTLQPRQFSKSGSVGQVDKSWMANPNAGDAEKAQTVIEFSNMIH